MSVLIQINGETAGEAIEELATLAAGIGRQAVPATTTEAPKSSRASRSTTKPDSAPVKEEPQAQAEAEPEHEGDGVSIPTDVELRALASEIGQKGADAKKAVKALLDKYGSPNVTGVPDDMRIAFKRELEALAAEDSE